MAQAATPPHPTAKFRLHGLNDFFQDGYHGRSWCHGPSRRSIDAIELCSVAPRCRERTRDFPDERGDLGLDRSLAYPGWDRAVPAGDLSVGPEFLGSPSLGFSSCQADV